jgi:hypothetical protein
MANSYLFFVTTRRKIRMKNPKTTATVMSPITRLPTIINTISNSIMHQIIIIIAMSRPIKLSSLFQLRLGYAYVYFSQRLFLLVASYRVRISTGKITSMNFDVQIFICIVDYHFSFIRFAHRFITWFILYLFYEPSSTNF